MSLLDVTCSAATKVWPIDLPVFGLRMATAGSIGAEVDGHTVSTPCHLVSPGQSIRFDNSANSRILAATIDSSAIQHALRLRLGDDPSAPIQFAAEVDEAAEPILAITRTMAHTVESGLLRISPLAAGHFEQTLIHALVDAQKHTFTHKLASQTRLLHPAMPAALRRAMTYCEEHAHEPISVAHIALAARVSLPTLQQHFRTQLQTTPLQYLRRVRLDHAHQDLLAILSGHATGDVTLVALRWGFTHLGRFAAFYKSVYGHTPSQTLKSTPRPAAGVA
ncbi:AraC family transcriptional regulator [[Kitasatospora] papulosa]|uniref:AraC family transcriptional regulator n=1 Tax=[Kitasatospora] papulosa TaxID=1464011 RepID=UPI0036C6B813